MKLRATALAVAVAMSCPIFAPAVAFAQGADDPTTQMARARFMEGVDFFDKGKFEQARAAFLQAYALKKHPAVLLNLAQSCNKSNHPLEAAKYFQQYLREATDIKPEQKRDAEKGLAEARTKLGRLDVQAPQGTEITIDTERVGFAPLAEPVDVEPGAHVVKTKGPDGAKEQPVTVAAGQTLPVKIGAGAGAAVVPPPPPPTNPPPTEPPPANPPPTEPPPPAQPPPPAEAPPASGGRRTMNMPLVVGGAVSGGIGLAGFILAGIMAGAKSSAQNNVTAVEDEIRRAGGGPGTCVNPTPTFASACATLQDNINAVNTDATVANVGLAFGIIGVVGAAVLIPLGIYGKKEPAQTGFRTPQLTPWIGGQGSGLTLSGAF
jgi:hypothetical protein